MVKMNAWLITWEVLTTTESNLDKIAAILSSRKSSKIVFELVEQLYLRSIYSAYDMAYYANRRNKQPYKAQEINGQIWIGGNPCWLYARRVTNLKIRVDQKIGKEFLSWQEPPKYEFQGYNISTITEGETIHWERNYLPLSVS